MRTIDWIVGDGISAICDLLRERRLFYIAARYEKAPMNPGEQVQVPMGCPMVEWPYGNQAGPNNRDFRGRFSGRRRSHLDSSRSIVRCTLLRENPRAYSKPIRLFGEWCAVGRILNRFSTDHPRSSH